MLNVKYIDQKNAKQPWNICIKLRNKEINKRLLLKVLICEGKYKTYLFSSVILAYK